MVSVEIDMKRIRALVIKDYLEGRQCFCFSCGNSSRALQLVGANVIGISPHDSLKVNTHVTPKRAQAIFKCFNATSGYLPLFLIEKIADELIERLPCDVFTNKRPICVPVGSGETLFTFSYVFPINRLIGVVDKNDQATSFNPEFSTLYAFINNNYKIIEKKDLPANGYQIEIIDHRKAV